RQSAPGTFRCHLAGRGAAGEPALPGLSIFDRNAPRSDRACSRNVAPRYGRARLAFALGRGRTRSEPVRVHVPAAGRTFTRRHHDTVPQRGETDLPPATLPRPVHDQAEARKRNVEPLAPAPILASQTPN